MYRVNCIKFLVKTVLFAIMLVSPILLLSQKDMTYFSLKEALKHPEKVYRLDLSHQRLTEIPKSIGKLTNLKRLNLSHNKLTELPSSIVNITDMRRLHLNDNKLSKLPEGIYNFKKLKKLYLANNELNEISEKIGDSKKLKRLTLDGNNLTHVPPSIFEFEDLERLDLDNEVYLNLTSSVDSLSYMEVDSWHTINKTPDSIHGKPLEFYLHHPQIDEFSKLYIQDRFPLKKQEKSCIFSDSIFTNNQETAPFYLYLYFDLFFNYNSSYLKEELCEYRDNLLKNNPCDFIKGLISYSLSCVGSLSQANEATHNQILSELQQDCPELLEDRENLYFRVLNKILADDQKKGAIEVGLIYDKSSFLKDSIEKSGMDNLYRLTLINSDGNIQDDEYYFQLDKPKTFEKISPGKYTILLNCENVYNQITDSLDKEMDKEKAKAFNRENTWHYLDSLEDILPTLYANKLFQTLKQTSIYQRDITLESIDQHPSVIIKTSEFNLKARGGTCIKNDSARFDNFELPKIDSYLTHRVTSDECEPVRNLNDTLLLYYFRTEVYNPSLKRNDISKENMSLLRDIKVYLKKRMAINDEREYKLPFPLGAAYEMNFSDSTSITWMLDRQPYNNWEEEDVYPPYYAPLYSIDSSFYNSFVGRRINVVYSDFSSKSFEINRYKLGKDACSFHHSYPLTDSYKPRSSREPIFCSFYDLELVKATDSKVDEWLKLDEKCKHSYCDEGTPQKTFAQLKNIPNLYFTRDIQDNWMNRYPGRGLYLKVNDNLILTIWDYEVQWTECSCI